MILDTEQIKRDEGFRSLPYKCTAGCLTIGYGTNLDAGLSEKEAEYLLQSRLNDSCDELLTALPWVNDTHAECQRVLSNMTYQMGLTRLLKFKKTLAAMEAGNWQEAKAEMLDSNWARQTPNRANRLAERIGNITTV